MVSIITSSTNRNDIKPMFTVVTVPMMILCGLLTAISTLEVFGFWQPTSFESIFNSAMRPEFHTVLPISFALLFAFIALSVSPIPFCNSGFILLAVQLSFYFIPVGLLIFCASKIMTSFAISCKSVFLTSVFVKFRRGFDLLAFRAAFQYDCLRHILTSFKSMFKAVCGLRPADGLFYYRSGI